MDIGSFINYYLESIGLKHGLCVIMQISITALIYLSTSKDIACFHSRTATSISFPSN